MVVLAAMSCQRKISSPRAWAINIGSVVTRDELKIKANVNSFHACIKTKVAAVAIPGAARGRMMCSTA